MVHSFIRQIVHPFVRPNNLCSAIMLPKFRSFVRLIIRSFVCSFINPIHRSSFVRTNYSSFIVRSYGLFTVHQIVHSHYSSFIESRGENGSGIPVGYRIRIVQIPFFWIRIWVFLYSGRIRVVPGYCSFEYGTDTERGLPGYSGRIRVPGIRVPVFSFST
jgi:hypothetical protein